MLNTIGLWVIAICSLLALTLMILYARGVLAKWTKPLAEKRKERAEAKKQQQQAEELQAISEAEEEAQPLLKDFTEQEKAETPQEEELALLRGVLIKKKAVQSQPEESKKDEEEKKDETRRISFLTAFHKYLFGVFFAGTILFLPYYWDYFAEDFLVFRFFKMLFMAIHNTVRLFILDGDFEPIQYTLRYAVSMGAPGWLTAAQCIYGLYATVLYLVAPLMTAGFVLSLFKGITAYFKYQFVSKADEVYLISELNERSIELAKDILSEKRIAELPENERDRKRIIVFAEVFGRSEEKSFELISQAQNLGAYCFKRDVADLGLKKGGITKDTVQKVYFISENEDENVNQALIMIEACRKEDKFNTQNTHFYVFATTVESEAMLDFVDNGNMKVRRINENKDLAISALMKEQIFPNAIPCRRNKQTAPVYDASGKEVQTIFTREDLKVLRVLIVGLGNYGTELLKTLCWSCQMFTYVVEVYVFDKSDDGRARLSLIAPDLLKYSEQGDGIKRPYYKIDFTPDVDVNSEDFYKKLDEKLPGAVTSVFVTLGEDELNIQTAMGLRGYFGRRVQKDAVAREALKKTDKEKEAQMEWQETIPQIFSTVYSEVKNRIVDRNKGLKNRENKNYGITFIGDMTMRYSLSFIQQQELMKAGLEIHDYYNGAQEKKVLASRIERMETLLSSNDADEIEAYLKARSGYFKEAVTAQSQDISNRVKALSGGNGDFVQKWEKELQEYKTKVAEDEISALKEELAQKPGAVLKEARLEDCAGLIKTVNKKKQLKVIADWFERVLKPREESLEAKLNRYKTMLRQLIEFANDWIYRLSENILNGRKDFDRYEYYRSSSIATAIHENFRDKYCTKEVYDQLLKDELARDEKYQQGTEEEREEIYRAKVKKMNGDLEHLRWQAYMWAEGYQKGLYRSAIDKTHHKLVATDERTREDRNTSEEMAGGSHQ